MQAAADSLASSILSVLKSDIDVGAVSEFEVSGRASSHHRVEDQLSSGSGRPGDLSPSSACRNAAEEHDAVFRHDRTHNLITRLRHNVIRTGLRRINMAYSRISLADVATRLGELLLLSTPCLPTQLQKDWKNIPLGCD